MNKKISEMVKRGKTIFKSKIKWILALILLTEHYSLGDIFIYTSADEEKGVLFRVKRGVVAGSLKVTCWHSKEAGMTSSWTHS